MGKLKEKVSNLFYQLADRALGDWFIHHREIYKRKDEEGYGLPYDLKGLHGQLLSFQGSNWDLSIAGLAKIGHCTVNKVERMLNDLEELGYFKRLGKERNEKGIIRRHNYKVFETANSELWDKTETKNFSEKTEPNLDEPYLNESNLGEPNLDEPNLNNYAQYNNKNNTIINNNNKKEKIQYSGNEVSAGDQTNSFKESNTYEHVKQITCPQIPKSNNTFRKEKQQINMMQVGVTKLNNPENADESKKKGGIKGYDADGNPVKNKSQVVKAIESVDTVVKDNNGKIIGEQTQAEIDVSKQLDEVKKKNALLQEQIDKLQFMEVKHKNRVRHAEIIADYLKEDDSMDDEMRELWNNYIAMRVEKGFKITKTQFLGLKEELISKNKEIDKQKECLQMAISGGWMHLNYDISESNSSDNSKKPVVYAIDVMPESEKPKKKRKKVLDENGNPVRY